MDCKMIHVLLHINELKFQNWRFLSILSLGGLYGIDGTEEKYGIVLK
jgi:hypothetical protein